MFTGLIETLGTVTSVHKTASGMKLSVRPVTGLEFRAGDSVSVNGVCLTATSDGSDLSFDISPETTGSTNLGELLVKEKVNLERALRLSDRLGGHMVTGHVDAVGTIRDRRESGEYTFFSFEAPDDVLRYIVQKGSVAVDGISLTVTGLAHRSFSVAIIPHTLTATNIGSKRAGNRVNIEVDIIGKYVEKFLGGERGSRLESLLSEKGFRE
jgi:riboflavin synthase